MIFPIEKAVTRLVGAILLEQNEERTVQRARYMTLETVSSGPGSTMPCRSPISRHNGLLDDYRFCKDRQVSIRSGSFRPGLRS